MIAKLRIKLLYVGNIQNTDNNHLVPCPHIRYILFNVSGEINISYDLLFVNKITAVGA